jgi:cell division protein ZapA (FtsZ GTPase activity inhibitor)
MMNRWLADITMLSDLGTIRLRENVVTVMTALNVMEELLA